MMRILVFILILVLQGCVTWRGTFYGQVDAVQDTTHPVSVDIHGVVMGIKKQEDSQDMLDRLKAAAKRGTRVAVSTEEIMGQLYITKVEGGQ